VAQAGALDSDTQVSASSRLNARPSAQVAVPVSSSRLARTPVRRTSVGRGYASTALEHEAVGDDQKAQVPNHAGQEKRSVSIGSEGIQGAHVTARGLNQSPGLP
jgi:hypothetical protein